MSSYTNEGPPTTYPDNTKANSSETDDDDDDDQITLTAKYGKKKLSYSTSHTTTISTYKQWVFSQTNILPKRQKLIGLKPSIGTTITDEMTVAELKLSKTKSSNRGNTTVINKEISFILMGTAEQQIIQHQENESKLINESEVLDDFDLEFTHQSEEWVRLQSNSIKLQKFTQTTAIHFINEPRENKKLLVLDLDHTLMDFSSSHLRQANTHTVGDQAATVLKRPYMDEFLSNVYPYYDLVIWSQTSWRWLETKLTELGMLTHPGYKICFVLDKTSMFSVVSTGRNGQPYKHQVKPLKLIWDKMQQVNENYAMHWGNHNTIHIDDLRRNFALNRECGLTISGYYRKRSKSVRDIELLGLSTYLVRLAQEVDDFTKVNFDYWKDVVTKQSSFPTNQSTNSGTNEKDGDKK